MRLTALITSPTSCQDVVQLSYTTNRQEIEVMELALKETAISIYSIYLCVVHMALGSGMILDYLYFACSSTAKQIFIKTAQNVAFCGKICKIAT